MCPYGHGEKNNSLYQAGLLAETFCFVVVATGVGLVYALHHIFFGQDVGHTLLHQCYGFHVLNCVSLSTEKMQYLLHLLYSALYM